ncbi:unnamed protein product [marine sediment metagenome]|uniref:Uncharacterized protein n=1 Tax=marine sediment metagenome TaxID=412755 RepID=X1VPS7_9ZZZZ
MKIALSLMLIICLISPICGCQPSEEERIRAEEDRIVVECAESMLWEFSHIYTPEWGFISYEDSRKAFLIELAMDDIFLFEDEHPFTPKEFDNYIQFKADYYREFFQWERLPPEDIIQAIVFQYFKPQQEYTFQNSHIAFSKP